MKGYTLEMLNEKIYALQPTVALLNTKSFNALVATGSTVVCNSIGMGGSHYYFIVERGHRVGLNVTTFENDEFNSPFHEHSFYFDKD